MYQTEPLRPRAAQVAQAAEGRAPTYHMQRLGLLGLCGPAYAVAQVVLREVQGFKLLGQGPQQLLRTQGGEAVGAKLRLVRIRRSCAHAYVNTFMQPIMFLVSGVFLFSYTSRATVVCLVVHRNRQVYCLYTAAYGANVQLDEVKRPSKAPRASRTPCDVAFRVSVMVPARSSVKKPYLHRAAPRA